jgi:carbon storage regulator
MLVLSRKLNQAIRIGDDIEVVVLEVHGERVKLGFHAPAEVPIHRQEVHERLSPSPPALDAAECA